MISTPATREALHALIDKLPESTLVEAGRYLTGLTVDDPVLRAALLAPPEDEEISQEEEALVAEARPSVDHGEGVPDDELDQALGW